MTSQQDTDQNTPTNTLEDVLDNFGTKAIVTYRKDGSGEPDYKAEREKARQQIESLISQAVNKARQHELNRLVIDKELDLGWYLRFDGAECNPQESGEENVANAVMDYVEARIKELETSNQVEGVEDVSY